jgi:hypothetical protein
MSIDLKVFLTKEKFAEQIEQKVLSGDFTHFEAIIDFADECDKSPEEMLPFMSQVLLEKVRKSANDSGLINTNDVDLESLLD